MTADDAATAALSAVILEAARYRACASRTAATVSFSPLRTALAFQQEQFFADQCGELVRAGRIVGKGAYVFAMASYATCQGLRHYERLLKISERFHVQASHNEVGVAPAEHF